MSKDKRIVMFEGKTPVSDDLIVYNSQGDYSCLILPQELRGIRIRLVAEIIAPKKKR